MPTTEQRIQTLEQQLHREKGKVRDLIDSFREYARENTETLRELTAAHLELQKKFNEWDVQMRMRALAPDVNIAHVSPDVRQHVSGPSILLCSR